ncbi:MAG: adenylate/guanylate cyclase domain-containing protein [Actinomycetota bacterium]
MTDQRPRPGKARRLLGPLSTLGHTAADSARTRTAKTTLVLTTVIGASMVLPWGIFYIWIGVPQAGIIPIFYSTISFLAVWHLHRTKEERLLRYTQVILFLMLPMLVHLVLGGFVNSSGVVMYSFVGVVGALSFANARRPGLWFATYAAIVLVLVPLDETVRAWAPELPQGLIIAFFAINMVTVSLIVFFSMIVYVRARDQLADELEYERSRSDAILRNVLPESIAERLKDGEQPIADRHDRVAVLFADIVDFTPQSERLSADELVDALNAVFSDFDEIALRHGVEKVKTVGDAYMVMAGAPDPGTDVNDLADVALAMREAAHGRVLGHGEPLQMRFGMDVGPLVAGVIGESRFLYDVYGDTVNTASRMESNGVPDRIQITSRAKDLLDTRFTTSERGPIDIKGKGTVTTYFLDGYR